MITRTFYEISGEVVELGLENGEPVINTTIPSFTVYSTTEKDELSILKHLKARGYDITPRSMIRNFKMEKSIYGMSDEIFIKYGIPVTRPGSQNKKEDK